MINNQAQPATFCTLERLVQRRLADTPHWVSAQSLNERNLLLKQMSYVRSLGHHDFLLFT